MQAFASLGRILSLASFRRDIRVGGLLGGDRGQRWGRGLPGLTPLLWMGSLSMLRYDIDPADLDVKNRDLIKVNREILRKLSGLVEEYIKQLEGGRRSAKLEDRILQQRFRVLVAMAIQFGLDAGSIADQLGVTVSTVHRWAKGTFVPPQVFVRAAAMRGIHALLQQELDSLDVSGREPPVPEKYRPQVFGIYSEADQDEARSVLTFGPSKTTK